ncbi:MAG: 16S rRNA (guanine(966)-N(2))-methyltransferase RsmD [Clostridia bacterium]|nr:16S rRNA (guanine(966)-N(2))-methyltransferase RsmD [Clostridia bacterium]
MRVIAGLYKGRKLAEFKGFDVRPTSDMARESLFNVLNFRVQDSVFLDAFSGTGAVGIEALSRGARKVVFNDYSKESIKIIKENLAKISNPSNVEIKNGDAINLMKVRKGEFDIVFLDPPYNSSNVKEILESARESIKEDGIIIFEDQKPYLDEIYGLEIYDQRRYGKAYFSFFRRKQ